jgi:RHS repeat-associated protein
MNQLQNLCLHGRSIRRLPLLWMIFLHSMLMGNPLAAATTTVTGPANVIRGTIAEYAAVSNPVPPAALNNVQWTVKGGRILIGKNLVENATIPYGTAVKVLWECEGSGEHSITGMPSFSLVSHKLSVQLTDPESEVVFNHSEMSNANTKKNLVFDHCAGNFANCSKQEIEQARAIIKLDVGEDYDFGKNAFGASVHVAVTAYGSSNGNVPVAAASYVKKLVISAQAPEQVFSVDFTKSYADVYRYEVKILSYGASPFPQITSKIRLSATIEQRFKTDIQGAPALALLPVNTNSSPGTNKITLNWNTGKCNEYPNYEVQILRLYNENGKKISNPKEIDAVADWSKALHIETQSAAKSFTLTLVEGTGYYAWRVRPLGNYYPGGIGNSKNWGQWSASFAQNQAVSLTNNTLGAYCFFYTQFNENMNWIYSRSFVGYVEGKGTQLKENIMYANGLGQVEQQQSFVPSQDNVLVSATVHDFSGRPSLTTMTAPVTQAYLQYIPGFAKNQQGELYTAKDFDSDLNYQNPKPITNGLLSDYYSNKNPDQTVPNAMGYPYSRTLFSRDGENRVIEYAQEGPVHRIRTDSSRTNQVFYGSVTDDELTSIFGDEAPAGNSVTKKISSDANKTKTVEYISKEGQLLATCLSYNNSTENLVDALPFQPLDIQEKFDKAVPIADGLLSSKSVTLTEPTSVQTTYQITPKTIAADCGTYCVSCEYKVYFYLKSVDGLPGYPKKDSLIIKPGVCAQGQSIPYAINYGVLPAGTYVAEKKITINNINPATKQNYLEEAAAVYRKQLEDELKKIFDPGPVKEALAKNDLKGLNAYLAANYKLDAKGENFIVPTSCDPILVPFDKCPEKICPPQVDFAQMLVDRWKDDPIWGGQPNLQFEMFSPFPNYTKQKFNQMVLDMMDGKYITKGKKYSCDELWNAWYATVEGWKTNHINYKENGKKYDFAKNFVDLAGRQFQGQAFPGYGQPGYYSHSYAFINGNAVTPLCVQAANAYAANKELVNPPVYPNFPAGDSAWVVLYNCYNSPEVPLPANLPDLSKMSNKEKILTMAQGVMDSCRTVCENRAESFRQVLINAYLSDDHYVYQPQEKASNAGQVVITDADIQCSVEKLVAECQEGCNLTISTSPNNPDVITKVGTAAEIKQMGVVMTFSFDLKPASTAGACPGNDWIPVGGSLDATVSVANHLNSIVKGLRSGLKPGGSVLFNTYTAMAAFDKTVTATGPGQCRDAFQVLIKYGDNGVFEAAGCDLYYVVNGPNVPGATGKVKIKICNWLCSNKQCPAVCLRWKPFPVFKNPEIIKPISCEEQSVKYMQEYVMNQGATIIDKAVAAFKEKYANVCLDANVDTYSLGYKLGYYQYTLHYYDRAGNLVKTVPPKGVNLLKPNADPNVKLRKVHPEHTLATEYEYNALGQMVRMNSADGGDNTFYYNKKGLTRFMQDPNQKKSGRYSYVRYDELDRIIETGQSNQAYAGSMAGVLSQTETGSFPATGTERVIKQHSVGTSTVGFKGRRQRYLLNRVSHQFTDEDGLLNTTADQVHVYYSYDPHGNIEWIAQQMSELGTNYVGYEYDVLTNEVLKVSYNPGRTDAFYHKYNYDGDGRIVDVFTSRDNLIWDRDANYTYASHGTLKRIVLGEDKVQGLDFAFTLQGWLKAINHPSLNPLNDPAKDGAAGSKIPQDVFGTMLTYHQGDFQRNGSPLRALPGNPYHTLTTPLYDGNIASVSSNIEAVNLGLQFEKAVSQHYRYDELGRLKGSEFASLDANAFVKKPDYAFQVSYDANGNFDQLTRQGYQAHALAMDELSYNYYAGTNRLKRITDAVPAGAYGTDLDSQADASNYSYDENGNLTGDKQEGIQKINWGMDGKVREIQKTNGQTIRFAYDGNKNRVKKTILTNGAETTSYYYVYDANGIVRSMYEKKKKGQVNEFKVTEMPIVGGKRLGTFKPMLTFVPGANGLPVAGDTLTVSRRIDQKQYEIQDHLSNVRAVVSDVKRAKKAQENGSDYKAYVESYSNYDAFGQEQPGRSYSSSNYRYGYNGKEKDDEVNGVGNSYDYGSRFYDPRVGRFLSLDPLKSNYPERSPYLYAANNPILYIDKDGEYDYKIGMDGIRERSLMARDGWSKEQIAEYDKVDREVKVATGVAMANVGLAAATGFTGTIAKAATSGLIAVAGQAAKGDYKKIDWFDVAVSTAAGAIPGGGIGREIAKDAGSVLLKASVDVSLEKAQIVGGDKSAADFGLDVGVGVATSVVNRGVKQLSLTESIGNTVKAVVGNASTMVKSGIKSLTTSASESLEPMEVRAQDTPMVIAAPAASIGAKTVNRKGKTKVSRPRENYSEQMRNMSSFEGVGGVMDNSAGSVLNDPNAGRKD